MDSYLTRYYQYLKLERGFSLHTIDAYIRDVRKFFSYIQTENLSPIDVKLDHFHDFAASLVDIGIHPVSLARILVGVHSFYHYLVLMGDLRSDPMELMDFPSKPKYLPDFLTTEEVDRIEAAIDLSEPYGHRNRAIIETLFSCGLRVSELCNLKMQDLFFEQEFIRVNGKGSKQRLVPISQRAINDIQLYFTDRLHTESRPGHEDYVFLSRLRKKMSRITVFHFIKQLVEQTEIQKHVSPHTFRHSFATALLEGGANLRAIQTMLGHEQIGTTEIYLHTNTQHLRDEILHHHPRELQYQKAHFL